MNKLAEILKTRLQEKRTGLVVYITAGCPDYQTTVHAVVSAAQAGADVVEIGLPFSDPMADGPIIQKAAAQALQAGATTVKTLAAIGEIRRQTPVALAIMTYMNTVLNYGVEQFVCDFAQAGVSGLIIPDLPVEECEQVEAVCRRCDLSLIQFIAPTSTADRIAAISAKANGFVYAVSSAGVTGVRDIDYRAIGEVISEVRHNTSVPTAIGFGIGTTEAASRAAQHADAVIIGSAVMQLIINGGVGVAGEFIGSVRAALDERRQ